MSFFYGFLSGRATADSRANPGSAGEGLAALLIFCAIIGGITLSFLGIINVFRALAQWVSYLDGGVSIGFLQGDEVGRYDEYYKAFYYDSRDWNPNVVAAVAVASIAAILITVRALVGSRLLFIAYCITVFALVGLVLSTCDLEHVCKGSIVAFDRGEDWLSFSNGLGDGPVGAYGTVFLLGSLIGARCLVQRSKAHALFESLNHFFFNWRRAIAAVSIIIALAGLAFNVGLIGFFAMNPEDIPRDGTVFTIIAYLLISTATIFFLIFSLKNPDYWKFAIVGLCATGLTFVFHHLYTSSMDCNNIKNRAGYEIAYQEYCGWHQDIFGSS
ncbi:hypothetical protein [Ruegeria jejuensis]|uniref:hypothetical protein n=1 Tax=Ruegeria jejuensis TaxID=3233338 RepID=UPI00355B4B57